METITLSASRFFVRQADRGRRRLPPALGSFLAKQAAALRAIFSLVPALFLLSALGLFPSALPTAGRQAFAAEGAVNASAPAPPGTGATGPAPPSSPAPAKPSGTNAATASPSVPTGPSASPARTVAPHSGRLILPWSTPDSSTGTVSFPKMHWTVLAPGLELGLSHLPESREKGTNAVFAVLRIDPALHHFSLGMASETGQALSLAGWSRKLGLHTGINASMYLPDNLTSVGYMRNGGSLNNGNMGNKLGAFFVAGRRNGAGPPADIIERDTPDWRKALENYSIVVQNYRLMDSRGKALWPAGGPLHSIAVVGKDMQGRIVFILSQEPLTAERFVHYLKSFSLALSTAMYVEGGAQAGLFLRVDNDAAANVPASFAGASTFADPEGVIHVWKGRQSLLNTRGNPDAPVPNILGATGAAKAPSLPSP